MHNSKIRPSNSGWDNGKTKPFGWIWSPPSDKMTDRALAQISARTGNCWSRSAEDGKRTGISEKSFLHPGRVWWGPLLKVTEWKSYKIAQQHSAHLFAGFKRPIFSGMVATSTALAIALPPSTRGTPWAARAPAGDDPHLWLWQEPDPHEVGHAALSRRWATASLSAAGSREAEVEVEPNYYYNQPPEAQPSESFNRLYLATWMNVDQAPSLAKNSTQY